MDHDVNGMKLRRILPMQTVQHELQLFGSSFLFLVVRSIALGEKGVPLGRRGRRPRRKSGEEKGKRDRRRRRRGGRTRHRHRRGFDSGNGGIDGHGYGGMGRLGGPGILLVVCRW